MYRIIEVHPETLENIESVGSKEKFWFSDKELGQCLFKKSRDLAGDEWSEKIGCEVARLLGLPHAEYELGQFEGQRGIVSPNFALPPKRLVLGNELLAKWVNGYGHSERRLEKRQHALPRVLSLIKVLVKYSQLAAPIDWDPPPGVACTAESAFVGYLMLDVLIANQDRHHANWGLVNVPPKTIHLAPTFDHASSLGTGETDEGRKARLTTRDKNRAMSAYVKKGKSAFYLPNATKPLGSLDAFWGACRWFPTEGTSWLAVLRSVKLEQLREVVDAVPDCFMTEPMRDFAFRVMELNRLRLLNEVER